MQPSKSKYIKQIKLQGKKEYFPNKYFTPYEFLEKFNYALLSRYDLKVIEVKYIVSKSKNIKDFDELYSTGNFEIEPQYNNIFSIDDDFMKGILKDVVELVPPKDFDYKKYEEETELSKRKEERRKIDDVDLALGLLSNIHNKKKGEKFEIRSISSFKQIVDAALRDSEVEVYIKAILNQAVEQRLQEEKRGGEPVTVKSSKGRQEIRVYLYPMKSDAQSVDLVANLSPIGDWSLCSFYPENCEKTNSSHGITYWSMKDIDTKAQFLNDSVKIQSFISLHKNKKNIFDSLEVFSFTFNEIVLKAVINLAQIKKIEYLLNHPDLNDPRKNLYNEYYIHLAYPPRYYISILKPQIGSDDGFIRNWERVENFMFLRNQFIMQDELIRLYLFSNTVFKIRITKLPEDRKRYEESEKILGKIISDFKGTVDCAFINQPWDLSKQISSLNTIFRYQNFKSKLSDAISSHHDPDKIWKVKYLILVLVRNNFLSPPEIAKLLDLIEVNIKDLDIFIYIFWQSTSILGTVNLEKKKQSYLQFLEKEYSQIKKLEIGDITKKISANTQSICYVFKAFLTPSGYLYNAPTPEMKGRLLKEYTNHSEHFMRVTICDDNEGSLKNQRYITKGALKSFMQEIRIVERTFDPLGWSPSQLRSYSLWYVHEYTRGNNCRLMRQQILSFLGNFDSIDNPARKAARIGQAFSASWTYLCKDKEITEQIFEDDYSSKGYMFTDGIGKISADLIERISLKLSIKDLSILQIRYKGAKGILVKDFRLGKNSIHLRKSMIKYQCNHEAAQKYLDILDWNKYKSGFLNRQTIILLRSLGVDNKVFMGKQRDHINRINDLSFKDCSIFKHMNQELNTDISNLEPANVTILHLLRAGFKLEEQPFFRGVLETMKKNGYHQLKMKSNIMIEKSARIVGIIDEYNILKEGELYCTVLDHLRLKPLREHVQGPVIITRNPCLHPADIRVMNCVSEIEISRRFQSQGQENIFSEFVNCVIFPKKGDIPVTAQISGSDLDGDNFFICWDRELIPEKISEVYLIDSPQNKKESKKEALKPINEQYQEMLDFFIEYLNYEKLGQIDNSHLVKADQNLTHYANDKDCIELAQIHGKAVDFPKTGFCPQVDPKLLVSTYPDFMEKQQSQQYRSKSILGDLYHDIQEKIQNLLENCQSQRSAGKIDEEILRELCFELKASNKKHISFDREEIREAIQILLNYQRELSGLITLVGVDTEYEIYSGNFTIAKEKVKIFGKNRLIATILGLRSRYFEQFFTSNLNQDKIKYQEAKEKDLEDPLYFSQYALKRAILFYLTSYIMKFNRDESFLNDESFGYLRKEVLNIFNGMSMNLEGKFCGFVWFVVPKLLINQKYRVRRTLNKHEEMDVQEKGNGAEKSVSKQDSDEEVI